MNQALTVPLEIVQVCDVTTKFPVSEHVVSVLANLRPETWTVVPIMAEGLSSVMVGRRLLYVDV
jgi:hypothetical protein